MTNNDEQLQKKVEEVQTLQRSLGVLESLFNLKDESYFRQQLLFLLDRIAIAQERTATATEKLGLEDEFTEDYTVKE
jgi:hypothetical protein